MTRADIIRENLRLSFQLAATMADDIANGEEVVLVVNPFRPHLPVILDVKQLVAELRYAIEGTGGGFSNATTRTQDRTRTGAHFSQVDLQKEPGVIEDDGFSPPETLVFSA